MTTQIEQLIEKYKKRYNLLNIPGLYELEHKARKSELQNIIQDLQDLLPEDKEKEVVVNKDGVYHNGVCVKKYSKSRLDIMLCPHCKEKIIIKKL